MRTASVPEAAQRPQVRERPGVGAARRGVLADVLRLTSEGATPRRAAAELGVDVGLVEAALDLGVRLGLVVRPAAGARAPGPCGGCPTRSPLACAGCPFAEPR